MVNMVFVMPCLVISLTLFKLFLHCVMYQLNFINETTCLINVDVTINGDIFLKDDVQWKSLQVPKTCLKWQCVCGRIVFHVVCMLYVMQLFTPQLGMFVAISSKKMNDCPVEHLYFSICLQMKGCTLLQLSVYHVTQI